MYTMTLRGIWLGTLVMLARCAVRNEPHHNNSVIVFRMDDQLNFAEYPPVPDDFFLSVDITIPNYHDLGLLPVFDLRPYSSMNSLSNCSNFLDWNNTSVLSLGWLAEQGNWEDLAQRFSNNNGWKSKTTFSLLANRTQVQHSVMVACSGAGVARSTTYSLVGTKTIVLSFTKLSTGSTRCSA